MPIGVYRELILPEGHFAVQYDYTPSDPGDREHEPAKAEVFVARVTDLGTGIVVSPHQNPELFERFARLIEERINEYIPT